MTDRVSVPRDLGLVLLPFAVSRAVVLATYALAGYLHQRVPQVRTAGIHGWDANYYLSIAAHGYGATATPTLRFWPLTPILVHGLSAVGVPAVTALLLLCNAASFVLALLLVRLGRVERWDERAVALLPWLVLLAPPAYVLVTGYAEAVGALLGVVVFLGARSGRWWPAAAAGLLAGLDRPLGLVLAVPVLVEVVRRRQWRPSALLAVAAPVVGTGAYVVWADVRYGHPLYPYRVQSSAQLRGGFTDPLTNLADAARGTLHHQIGTGTHVPWLVLALVLLIPMARLLPPSYTAYAGVSLLAIVVSSNLSSTERYLWSAFPFLVVVAVLVARSLRSTLTVLTLSTGLLVAYGLLSFVAILPP